MEVATMLGFFGLRAHVVQFLFDEHEVNPSHTIGFEPNYEYERCVVEEAPRFIASAVNFGGY